MAGPRYVMAGASLQLACGAVTARLDTRQVNPGARALPDPGMVGFIRSLWVTGSAGQGLREARAYCGRQSGAHHRAGHGESAGADPGHRGDPRPGGRQQLPGFCPRSKWDRNLVNWELPDLAGVSHAVATGRVTSRGLRVGTPGPWAGRAKEAMPRGLSLRVFRGTCALLSFDLPDCVLIKLGGIFSRPASPRGQAYPSALQSGQGHPRGAL